MKQYDVILLTESQYIDPIEKNAYIQNVLTEDGLVKDALERSGCRVKKVAWDCNDFDWSSTHYALFRTTWDYFYRFEEFKIWLEKIKDQTQLINTYEQIIWNLDKHYLKDIAKKGINIPPSYFIKKHSKETLSELHKKNSWKKSVLKPTISGAARHTYKLSLNNLDEHEDIFSKLIQNEDFMLQEFQDHVISKGEVAFMIYGGKYSHAILKKAKAGDFRVQDDFGGTVHNYNPTEHEIAFAEKAIQAIDLIPLYSRVDMIWDNNKQPAVSELELIEPELWFRFKPESAELLARLIVKKLELKNLN